jgi:hypothetical protein
VKALLPVGESNGCRFSRQKPFPGVWVAPGVALTMRGYLRGSETDAILNAV